jgi:Tol biopolymer transport system component
MMKMQLIVLTIVLNLHLPSTWADSFTNRLNISSGSTLAPQGVEANSHSFNTAAAISSDERFVVFSSDATNLVANDRNDASDIFLRDRWFNQTTRISVDNAGIEGNAASTQPVLSANGRFIAFSSKATNFVAGEANGVADIFIYDTQTKQVRGINPLDSNGDSVNPSITADGRWVVFESLASNLIADDTNSASDIFAFDTQSNQLTRLSINDAGVAGDGHSFNPIIAANGNFVVFASEASNLVAGDTNVTSDIFLHNLTTHTTQRISQTAMQTDRGSYHPSIDAAGKVIVFESDATSLVENDSNAVSDIFIKDLTTGQLQRITSPTGEQANSAAYYPTISATGRYVAFTTAATNLVSGNANALFDILKYDRQTQQLARVNVSVNGEQGNFQSLKLPMSLSWNGDYAVFTSNATNVVYGDNNLSFDVFVYQAVTPVRAAFSFKTNVLTLPLVKLSDGRTFNAQFLMNAQGFFVLQTAEELHLDTPETSGFFSLMNGMLYLSMVSVAHPSSFDPATEETDGYEATLLYVPNTDPLQFQLLHAEILNL